MKNLLKYIVILAIGIIVYSCNKTRDPLNGASGLDNLYNYSSDTTFTANYNFRDEPKNVLMHEFSGIWCYTCPLAHDTTAKIIAMHPGRVFAINVHSHYYSIYDDPAMMGNLYDIRTLDGDTVVNMLHNSLVSPIVISVIVIRRILLLRLVILLSLFL